MSCEEHEGSFYLCFCQLLNWLKMVAGVCVCVMGGGGGVVKRQEP